MMDLQQFLDEAISIVPSTAYVSVQAEAIRYQTGRVGIAYHIGYSPTFEARMQGFSGKSPLEALSHLRLAVSLDHEEADTRIVVYDSTKEVPNAARVAS